MNKPTITYFAEEPSLQELQKVVGGYIEAVPTHDGRVMYVNEEGLMRQLAFNPEASEMASRRIVGNVAVIGGSDESSD